ncbi:MAG: alpha/beta hydrolase [Desulfovibrionaceae bacterium]|nr:alpha/beta hydrolase [Desulfovibrionaceae bacterium]
MRFLTEDDSIRDMVSHPAFAGIGACLVPRPADAASDLPLALAGRLMPWHGQVRPQAVVAALNRLIRERAGGRTIFCRFYESGPAREATGLFFFRGRPGAPFALICPGGGFAYVGSLHEGFPVACEIADAGFNAFVLHYRTGSGRTACIDLAHALVWILKHARDLGVDPGGYSLWGGSAGARMAAAVGSYGPAPFGAGPAPRPAAVIMGYTGHTDWQPGDPPTYAVVSRDDPIADWRVMRERLSAMSRAGIRTRFRLLEHAGHGFGTGEGSEAEGWMQEAVAFWQEQLDLEAGERALRRAGSRAGSMAGSRTEKMAGGAAAPQGR